MTRSANVEPYIGWYGVFCVTQKPYHGLALAGFDLKHRDRWTYVE
jgi:hypothetical protein